MKITHIVMGLPLGGIESMLVNICMHQSKYAKITVVVINDLIDEAIFAEIKKYAHVVCIRRKIGSRSPVPLVMLNLFLLRTSPDIIHCHTPTIIKFLFPYFFRKKLCITMHSICTDRSISRCLHRYRSVFSISQSVQDSIKSTEGIDSKVIPNGIQTSNFRANNEAGFHSPVRIVQVGRLIHETKGQHVLLEALSMMRAEYSGEFILDFIGDGPSLAFLQELANGFGLSHCVNFIGAKPQSYLHKNLCSYDIFVQPSIHEGFGLTVVEAIAAKIQVLVSDVQGPYEIIKEGKYGFFFKSNSPSNCSQCLSRIITQGKQQSIIDAAHDHVKLMYDVSSTAINYLNEYSRITSIPLAIQRDASEAVYPKS